MPRIDVALHNPPRRVAKAPPFTPEQHAAIADWAAAMREHRLLVTVKASMFRHFDEMLVVSAAADGEILWLAHRTPAGAVAVRPWPGLAEIVQTVQEALAVIAAWACAATTSGVAGPHLTALPGARLPRGVVVDQPR
jgi:hypothetical protein